MKPVVLLACLVAALAACGQRAEYSVGIPGSAVQPYPEPPASGALPETKKQAD
jgi:hypothetical protein